MLTPSEIDRLGHIKAAIADLQAEYDTIVGPAKAAGAGKYIGNLFTVTVSSVAGRQALDAKAAEAKLVELGVSRQWFAAHQKDIAGYVTVKVGVRS